MNSTHVFIGTNGNVIDEVNPQTGRSAVYGETLEQVQKRYPGASITTWEAYQERKAAQQDVPVEWNEITEERYDDMLNVLPPIYGPGGFLVSDHHAKTGQPRYAGFIQHGGKCYESSRPMTVAEFRKWGRAEIEFTLCEPKRATAPA